MGGNHLQFVNLFEWNWITEWDMQFSYVGWRPCLLACSSLPSWMCVYLRWRGILYCTDLKRSQTQLPLSQPSPCYLIALRSLSGCLSFCHRHYWIEEHRELAIDKQIYLYKEHKTEWKERTWRTTHNQNGRDREADRKTDNMHADRTPRNEMERDNRQDQMQTDQDRPRQANRQTDWTGLTERYI